MAVFRGNKRKKPSEETRIEPDTPDYLETQAPLLQADEPNYRGDFPGQTVGEEREQLDRHRSRASQEPADYYSPPKESDSAGERPSMLRRGLALRKQSRRQSEGKGASSALGRKVAIGLASLLMPTLIGLILFYLFLGAGGNLEHINRITNGIRFAGLHGEVRRRVNHISKVYTIGVLEDPARAARITRYHRTPLLTKVFTGGWDVNKAILSMNEHRIDIETKRFKVGSLNYFGHSVDTIDFKDGSDPIRVTRGNVDELYDRVNKRLPATTFREWLHKRATLRWLGKKTGMPFSRFRRIVKGLRSGSIISEVRVVRKAINGSIVKTRERLTRVHSGINGGAAQDAGEEISEAIEGGEVVDRRQARKLLKQRWREKFKNSWVRNFLRTARGLATIAEAITWSCIFKDINDQLENAFKLRIDSSMDSASTLLTTVNQMKAGEAHPQVIGDMVHRFEGFEQSAVYKGLVSDLPYEVEADFSQAFSNISVFGVPIKWVRSSANIFGKPAEILLQGINGFLRFVHFVLLRNPVVEVAMKIIRFFYPDAPEYEELEKLLPHIDCADILRTDVQIAITTIEIVVTVISLWKALVSGIAKGVAKVTGGKVALERPLKELVKKSLKQHGRAIAGKTALVGTGLALDIVIFNHVVPTIMENVSGVDTALLPGPDDIQFDPRASSRGLSDTAYAQGYDEDKYLGGDDDEIDAYYQGARNFATVDYGSHYLKEQQALLSGGSRRLASEETARTTAYMDAYKQSFAQKGLFNNLVALDNPFSVASSLAIGRPSSLRQAGAQTASFLTSLLSPRLFGNFFSSVGAQELSQDEIQQLLYPDQKWVVGFDQDELDGRNTGFGFIENTEWVWGNLPGLRDQYADCLTVDVSDFLYAQTFDGGNKEFYDAERCESPEAKRYKMAFLDCLNVEAVSLQGSGHSPFFSNACEEEFLPPANDKNGLANPLRYEDES